MEKTGVSATAKIYPAMAKIMESLKAVPKGEKNNGNYTGANGNSGVKYEFQSITDIMDALHSSLKESKVVISPRTISYETCRENEYKTVFKQVEFSFVSLEDGSVFEPRPVFEGFGKDPLDKADSKASTFAYKKMLQQVFCIPTKDLIDPDAENPVIPEKKTKPVAGSIDAELDKVEEGEKLQKAIAEIKVADAQTLTGICKKYPEFRTNKQFVEAGKIRRSELESPATAVADALSRQNKLNLKTA